MTTAGGYPCGCCEGVVARVPEPVWNAPAQPTIRRRIGTHATFKETLLARLASAGSLALDELRARTDDDFSIALLDAWSVAADVLTFYTERIANEHYLRTATELRSVLELARTIGYELRPGIAAEAALAFTIDASRGTPASVTVPSRTAVQSVPEPGEDPAVFETVEDIEARGAWNALRARPRKPHRLTGSETRLVLAGTPAVAVGDVILYRATDASTPTAPSVLAIVSSVDVDDGRPPTPGDPGAPATTTLVIDRQPAPLRELPESAWPPPLAPKATDPWSPTPAPASAAGPIVGSYLGQTVAAADLEAAEEERGLPRGTVIASVRALGRTPRSVLLFRTRAAILGHNAPDFATLPKETRAALRASAGITASDVVWKAKGQTYAVSPIGEFLSPTGITAAASIPWADDNLSEFPGPAGAVHLDDPTAAVPKGSIVVLRDGATWSPHVVSEARQVSMSVFTVSARGVRIKVDETSKLSSFSIRGTSVYARPEQLALADVVDPSSVGLAAIELDGLVSGLLPGRRVVVAGPSAADPGLALTHETTLSKVEHELVAGGTTRITLTDPLPGYVRRDGAVVHGNVAAATHGQTRMLEVLGSGDATKAFQRFLLRQPPLTYRSSSDPSGSATTLEVYVNDVRWREVPTLFGSGPDEQVYVTRLADDGATAVEFGDGITGARLPTGAENVRAIYRSGSGTAGLVRAGSLTMLMNRPGGVTDVVNPLAADGGGDRERLADARTNAPLTVRTIDRVVSLRDYEDFARAFPGVAKAHVAWTRRTDRRGVLVTVAGAKGRRLELGNPVHDNLLAALLHAGDPLVPVRLVSFTPRAFRMAVNVKVAANRRRPDVVAAVEAALRSAFGFDARDLGQPVTASEVLAAVHAVAGVQAAELDSLVKVGAAAPAGVPALLPATAPAAGAHADAPAAELLTLDHVPVTIGTLA